MAGKLAKKLWSGDIDPELIVMVNKVGGGQSDIVVLDVFVVVACCMFIIDIILCIDKV